jgi:hypothetical protein
MRVPGRQGLQGKIRFSSSSVDADIYSFILDMLIYEP